MVATTDTRTGDPCDRVFAVFARPHCGMCDDVGTITIDDDDGHDVYRSEMVPCPECEAGDEAAWWDAMNEAIQYHQDVGDWRPVETVPNDDVVPY